MIHLVATSDNHLGRYYARMGVGPLARRRGYLRAGFEAACKRALDWPADVFLIAGDLFDQTAPRNVERAKVAEWLLKLKAAGIPALAVAGNHDSPRSQTEEGGWPAVEVYQSAGLLHVFREIGNDTPQTQPQVLQVREHTLAIGGFSPSVELRPGQDPLDQVTVSLPQADLRVLIGHFLIEGWVHPDAAEAEPIARRASLEALRGVDLVVVGDIHQHHATRFGGVNVVVPGASERMDFGAIETTTPGFVEITWQPGRLDVRHLPISSQPRVRLDLGAPDLAPANPTGAVVAAVEQAVQGTGEDVLVLVRLSGTVAPEVYQALDLVEAEERLRGKVGHLDFEAGGLRPRRAQGVAGPRGPRRTLAEEIRLAAAEVADALPDDERATLDEVAAEIVGRLGGGGEGHR
jgi:DNA repair protein SbcD/Mre11